MKYIILALALILNSCYSNDRYKPKQNDYFDSIKKVNKVKALEINNEAIKIPRYIGEKFLIGNDSLLWYGISQFDLAISLDSNLESPYANKTEFLRHLNQFEKAIRWIDTMKLRFPTNKECVICQAFLYEKVGKSDSAKYLFEELNKFYLLKLKENPNDLNSILKIIEIDYYLSKNRQNALKRLDELLIQYPNNEDIKKLKYIIEEILSD